MKALIGVMPEAVIRARMLAIVKGQYKPEEGEPKVWFTSMNALAQVLSNENIALLRLMDEQKPETLTELAGMSGRQKSNLSVTLKTLNSHGFVRLEKVGRSVKPVAMFTDFDIQVKQEFIEKFSPKAA
ncbi:helix-turn-helix domain-containing protein [Pectobacterium quasiaquaticum]|uniref:Helix-turn-helix domain-containing protein n=1 Tax=Pectobacterium quasiaquaticum TaxID=2774015 RepID=A0A9Q2IEH7_9GAMM|nr:MULTISPECIES: helix-turn-helix domain-containing protein [Pectobacterium]MBE5202545.1 helix-turn-helix domain-containing protein [Pectobacterium quasiaquaticum]MBE5209614.1 helix-turn-helix domain-containing protein [Pectobacterium quasiaquaticum]MBE5215203.1 helix-turn-helix domain-containing protein [Pectobacterium quasiaquaticum]MBE5221985.1 helix-turn-helix domain-containing protein [Pectobacterium quasiaquaticum]MBE5224631.1 helix-turn-helix domain-containing protein [Pectobacterium qu